MIWSWRAILDAAYSLASTSTIETASSLITDLQTWSLLLSKTTPESMLQAVSHPDGWSGLVLSADELSRAVSAKISSIRALSVAGLAISKGHISRRDAEGSSGAWEPILVFRKPLEAGTVAAQVLATGTGALHVDACRVALEDGLDMDARQRTNNIGAKGGAYVGSEARAAVDIATYKPAGRWPSNLVLSHSAACFRVGSFASLDPDTREMAPSGEAWHCAPECPVAELDRQSGTSVDRDGATPGASQYWGTGETERAAIRRGAAGGASRFFPTFAYVAKASKSERDAGLDAFPVKRAAELTGRAEGSAGLVMNGGANPYAGTTGQTRRNPHPTVKPVALMRWLVRLVTPPGGVVLDPWAGSFSTGVAVAQESELAARFIGMELDADGHDYVAVGTARMEHALAEAAKPAKPAKLHRERARKPATASQAARTAPDTSTAPKAAPAPRRKRTSARRRAEALTYSLWGEPDMRVDPIETGVAS
jgi:site-specific DNA-methyltransferase (adenine-specific)